MENLAMFCYQCEQTAKGEGCMKAGVCGKDADVAALQDILVYALQGLSIVAVDARKAGINDPKVNVFTVKALFSTLTNVDFDPARFVELIGQCASLRDALKDKAKKAGAVIDEKTAAVTFKPATTVADWSPRLRLRRSKRIRQPMQIFSRSSISCCSASKAWRLMRIMRRFWDRKTKRFMLLFRKRWRQSLGKKLDLNGWVGLVLKCGEINLRTMELLDAGNTTAFGHPVPTKVPLGAKKGKAILISGHDLKDLSELLKQTEGKGINIYTHGEMLPAHGYPELKKYPHFYGHYGTAWQNQAKEFAEFPGAILMTTNCIQRPRDAYRDNIFTCGLVGWPGVAHIADANFEPVIKKALELPGFAADTEGKSVMVGFARNAVMGVAGEVIEAVKGKAIRHFFLVAGCDGAKPGRNYYTEFVEKAPKDTVVLTLACGKFRFFDQELGDIGGIPRLLDIGQCNDAYSAIQIAVALSKAFNCGVNDLPLSMILSWYEQKAVAILLTLLYLGIKDIRLGPSLPAFITPNVLNVLVQNFAIKPITTPDEDLKAILG